MKLTQQQLEAHLWGSATILRGRTAGQDYKKAELEKVLRKVERSARKVTKAK